MINPFFVIKKISYNFRLCISSDKKDKVMSLVNPQIIYVIDDSNQNIQSPVDLNTNFQDISDSNSDHVFNSNKFDKKNKLKQKKKVRSKSHLDNDEVFLDESNSNIITSVDNLSISLLRSSNTSKQKKKNKIKTELSINNTSVSSLQLDADTEKHNKEIVLDRPLTIQELSEKLNIPVAEIITRLFLQGISVTINQVVDLSIATKVANNYKVTIVDVSNSQLNKQSKIVCMDKSQAIKRAPIITIFGHVDHGKTTLLDKIRQTNLVKQEAGGITQSIAGYEVEWDNNGQNEKLIFLDTPGHEAFAGMRSRGVQVTDIAILVVAADDGLKTQSIEAINHILGNNIPFIVVINKVDKLESDIQKVKNELSGYGIIGEDWGGEISIIEVSAITGQNIDVLLSNICILSDLQELKADPKQLAEGTILEAYLDKKKGPVANVLIHNGTINIGDIIVSDKTLGKVKVLLKNNQIKVKSAGPSSVLEILGFSSVPNVGSVFKVFQDEKEAKAVISNYIDNNDSMIKLLNSRVTLDNHNKIESLSNQINIILKTDTQGSIEAVINAFAQIPQEKIQINILSANSGEISDKDLNLALTSNSLILGFNVGIASKVSSEISQIGVIIETFNVIYDLIDYVKRYMLNLVTPEYNKIVLGSAVVQTVFSVNKKCVAGCLVNSGKLKKNAYICVSRNNTIVYDGLLSSLKRLKDDVSEIYAINECGVMCNDYDLWEKSDIIEAYELNQKEKQL